MAYFTRVFCTTTQKPLIGEIIADLKSKGFHLNVTLSEAELDEKDWTNFELMYDNARLPLLVELNSKEGSDGLVEKEIAEFCIENNILVNNVTSKNKMNVRFGAILEDEDYQILVSSHGKNCKNSKKLRDEIKNMIK